MAAIPCRPSRSRNCHQRAHGKLQLNGVDIAVDAEITKAQIDAGNLKFVPAADTNVDKNGVVSFKFLVSDGKQFTATSAQQNGNRHRQRR